MKLYVGYVLDVRKLIGIYCAPKVLDILKLGEGVFAELHVFA
jgi:hypothetical protein